VSCRRSRVLVEIGQSVSEVTCTPGRPTGGTRERRVIFTPLAAPIWRSNSGICHLARPSIKTTREYVLFRCAVHLSITWPVPVAVSNCCLVMPSARAADGGNRPLALRAECRAMPNSCFVRSAGPPGDRRRPRTPRTARAWQRQWRDRHLRGLSTRVRRPLLMR
jgi:hypothetical protein